MMVRLVRGVLTATTVVVFCSAAHAEAAGMASPTPAPTISPSPPAHPVNVRIDGGITFVDQAASGPGTFFDQSLPYEPQTPYEFFSGTPGVTGNGVDAQLLVNAQYEGKRIRAGFVAGTESVSGNNTNILYLGEPVFPTVSPFVSSRNALFPSFLGATNQVALSRTSLLNASIGARDGSWNVKGGWFLPVQTLSFVFVPPVLPNALPAIAPQLPEVDAPNVVPLPQWSTQWPALPLQGIDASAHGAKYGLEFFDGALPTRYYSDEFSNTARVTSLSAAISGGRAAQFAVQVARVQQNMVGLTPIPAGILYGGDLETQLGPEGPEPDSNVYGQRATLAGFQAILHPSSSTAVTAEIGRSWFTAQFLSAPGQPTPGGYYHLGVSHSWGTQQIAADLYRFDPAYAPNVLPYGNFVNIWPVAWAWPANWLKFEYQLVANDDASVNRQGFRVRYSAHRSRFSYRAGYASFAQVTPFNSTTALQPGFTDPFFTSTQDATVSYRGMQRQFEGWLAWHIPALTASLDFVDDVAHRGAPSVYPDQAISLDIPQAMFTLSHTGGSAVYALGEGRFAIHGCYACNISKVVDIHQRVYFGGVNFRVGATNSWLVEWRRYLTGGEPIVGVPFSPAYTGTRVIVENRFSLP